MPDDLLRAIVVVGIVIATVAVVFVTRNRIIRRLEQLSQRVDFVVDDERITVTVIEERAPLPVARVRRR